MSIFVKWLHDTKSGILIHNSYDPTSALSKVTASFSASSDPPKSQDHFSGNRTKVKDVTDFVSLMFNSGVLGQCDWTRRTWKHGFISWDIFLWIRRLGYKQMKYMGFADLQNRARMGHSVSTNERRGACLPVSPLEMGAHDLLNHFHYSLWPRHVTCLY